MAKTKNTYTTHITTIREKLDGIEQLLDADITTTRRGAQAAGAAYSVLQNFAWRLTEMERTLMRYAGEPHELKDTP